MITSSASARQFRVGPAGNTNVIFGTAWSEALQTALTCHGVRRTLVLSSPGRSGTARAIVDALAERGVGLFTEAAQHVPRALAERAFAEVGRLAADAIVAIGGGSVIGLGKAVALLRDRAGQHRLFFAVLPTTYAGSEMTNIWGLERPKGVGKEVGRSPAVRPDLVVYDPALSASLPIRIAIPSLFNAMAHAVDALFPLERDDNGELADLAEQTVAELGEAITSIAEVRDAAGGRLQALAGSQKAGEILDRAGMSLHHKLAHVLGGTFSLPHAPTHTILLPHVVAFMAPCAPRAMARLGRALNTEDPAAELFDLQGRSGAPRQLRRLGLRRAGIDAAVDEVLGATIDSPRAIEAEPVRELLLDAWLGRRPSVTSRCLDAPG